MLHVGAAQPPADPMLEALVPSPSPHRQASSVPAAPLWSPWLPSQDCHTPAAASSCPEKEAAANFSPIYVSRQHVSRLYFSDDIFM